MIYKDIANKIKQSKKTAITFHASPDGDAIGSALGLLNGFSVVAKEISMLAERSREAAISIGEIIANVKKETESTILNVHEIDERLALSPADRWLESRCSSCPAGFRILIFRNFGEEIGRAHV